MDENYKDLEIKLESAYYNRNKVGTRVDKVDLVDAAKVIEEDLLTKIGDVNSSGSVAVAEAITDLQVLPIENKIAYCNESSMLYRYMVDITSYIQYGNTVISSDISGGWVEHDSYNKFLQPSTIIDLAHLNQSSSIILTAGEDFTAKVDTLINNGHTHVCKLFCNGFTPTFSGFTFMSDSSPLDIATIDTTSGYYHTIIFFKVAGDNKYIILEKVLSTDVTPPTITVSVASKTDATISYTINSDENSELKWALYAGGSTDKTISDIDAGTGALQHGAKSLASGDNTLTINSLTELTTYDLWQYAFDSVPNNSTPAKTTVQTNETGVSQLVAPILGTVTVLSTTSLSVPIASSSIDADASSVSLHYKRVTDPTYTIISNIGKTDVSHTLSALNVNTQYYIYLVAVGDGISYSDSTASNIATPTTQNIAPTLSVPYTSSSGLVIELPFSRAMANPSTQSGLFTTSGGKSVVSVALKSGDATKILVTVNSAYINTDTITITVASGLVPADNGVVFGGVSNQSVTNSVSLKSIVFKNTATDYITATPNASIIFGNGTTTDAPQSYSCRFKLLTLTDIQILMSRCGNLFGLSIYSDAGNLVLALYDENNTNVIYIKTTNKVVANTWYTLTATYDGTASAAGLCIYLNGVLQVVTYTTLGPYIAYPNAPELQIGRYESTQIFTSSARISDVAIIAKKLTQSESLELHNLGVTHASSLSFISDVRLYTRFNGTLSNEVGTVQYSIVGSLDYSTDGAY